MRALLFIALLAGTLRAGEGFWPLHSLPAERIKSETGVVFTPEQLQRAMKAAVQLRMGTTSGSGGVVSKEGLLVTNRHVVIEYLGALSPAGKNFVKDGFLAARLEDELPCKGLRVRTLVSQEKLAPRQAEQLKLAAGTPAEARMRRQLEQNLQTARRQPCEIVSLYGGSEFWLYTYRDYQDVRLVYAPDEGLGDFGGRDDNFSYPRHEIDVAFLRLYENGRPAATPDFLAWAERPLTEMDPVFVLGHPADYERGTPLSNIRFLCDTKLTVQSAIYESAAQALSERLKNGDDEAARLEAEFHRSHNRLKLFSRMREILRSPQTEMILAERETAARRNIKASAPALEILGTAYDICADACEQLKPNSLTAELSDLRLFRMNSAMRALLVFPERSAGLEGEDLARITRHIQDFFREGPLNSGFSAAVEEAQFAAQLAAAEKLLPLVHPLRHALLNGRSSADVARGVYRESKLASAEGCCALVAQGGKAVQESQDPALQFFRMFTRFEEAHAAELAAHAAQEQRRQQALRSIRKALHAANPGGSAPDANRTLRMSFGAAEGYLQGDLVRPWCTTFRSQVERAEAAKNLAPYQLSPLLLRNREKIGLDTPLNFVMTADGGPGCSGAPVLDRDGRVAGVFFDGNMNRVASLYYYAPPESGARSIGIHASAIVAGLKLAGAEELLKELRSGSR